MTDGDLIDPVTAGMDRRPTHPAIVCTDGRSYTFEELDAIVGTYASGLEAAEVTNETAIAVSHTDRITAVKLLLAIIRAGGVATPIDPSADLDTVEDRIHRGAVEVLLTDIERFQSVPCDTIAPASLQDTGTLSGTTIPADRSVTQLFTSGSTGDPKPIVHTARNHRAASIGAVERLDLGEDDRWFDPLGLHHMGGFAPVLRCLPEGLTVSLTESRGPGDWLDLIDETESSIASVVPTMLYRELEGAVAVPDQLRCILVGGAPLRESLYRRARAAELPIWASYGLTETVGQVATATPDERDEHPGTVGRPLLDTQLNILDEDGTEVATNTPGRIVVEGPTVSESVATSTTNGARLETNDIGQLDEADRLWIFGRVDHAIHTGGETVHPHRIEEVIADHPAIDDVAVVGMTDPEWGELVVAAIVSDASIDHTDIKRWAGDRLRPSEVPKTSITVESIPRTISGTIDRDILRERLEAADQ